MTSTSKKDIKGGRLKEKEGENKRRKKTKHLNKGFYSFDAWIISVVKLVISQNIITKYLANEAFNDCSLPHANPHIFSQLKENLDYHQFFF